MACLSSTNGASKRACSFSWPSISCFSGSRGCLQFGDLHRESPHQVRDESTLDEPRGAGAGRALGAGCAWLWSCRGVGNLLFVALVGAASIVTIIEAIRRLRRDRGCRTPARDPAPCLICALG